MIYIGEERNGYGRACMQCDYEAQRCCDKLAHVRVLLRTLVCVSRARMNVCMCERSRVRTPMSKRPYVAHTSEHAGVAGVRRIGAYVFRADGTAVCITDVIKITEVRAAMHNA